VEETFPVRRSKNGYSSSSNRSKGIGRKGEVREGREKIGETEAAKPSSRQGSILRGDETRHAKRRKKNEPASS